MFVKAAAVRAGRGQREHEGTGSERSVNEEKHESATAAGVSVKKLLPEVLSFLKFSARVVHS